MKQHRFTLLVGRSLHPVCSSTEDEIEIELIGARPRIYGVEVGLKLKDTRDSFHLEVTLPRTPKKHPFLDPKQFDAHLLSTEGRAVPIASRDPLPDCSLGLIIHHQLQFVFGPKTPQFELDGRTYLGIIVAGLLFRIEDKLYTYALRLPSPTNSVPHN